MKHLKFISDKVAKGCFNFEAIAGYDKAVRARVALEGYSEFANIETDEVFGHFSVENTIKKSDQNRGGKAGYVLDTLRRRAALENMRTHTKRKNYPFTSITKAVFGRLPAFAYLRLRRADWRMFAFGQRGLDC